MARVQLINISKRFEKNTAVNSVDLTIKDKEFLVLVGPSGCGKTTTLRMVAGLEEITEGKILIDDVKINDLSPRDRDVAMVFQNYALYPHMKVYKNMAFGLLVRKISKSIIDERVNEAAKILGIEELLDRKPRELSGGQRQRVAIGRAIVRKPKVFLFDEPLSNLDAKLRVQMRAELLKIHERLLTTIIYVTHDQLEAMTLADRIVVMNDGNIMQVGAPMDVYNNPQNLFVAGFIGSPTMNFFDVHMIEKDGIFYARGKNFKLKIPKENYQRYQRVKGREAILGIRPEHIYNKKLKKPFPGGELLKVMIEVVEPVGSEILLLGTCGKDQVTASVDPQTNVKPHTEMEFLVDMNCMHLFDDATEEVY